MKRIMKGIGCFLLTAFLITGMTLVVNTVANSLIQCDYTNLVDHEYCGKIAEMFLDGEIDETQALVEYGVLINQTANENVHTITKGKVQITAIYNGKMAGGRVLTSWVGTLPTPERDKEDAVRNITIIAAVVFVVMAAIIWTKWKKEYP